MQQLGGKTKPNKIYLSFKITSSSSSWLARKESKRTHHRETQKSYNFTEKHSKRNPLRLSSRNRISRNYQRPKSWKCKGKKSRRNSEKLKLYRKKKPSKINPLKLSSMSRISRNYQRPKSWKCKQTPARKESKKSHDPKTQKEYKKLRQTETLQKRVWKKKRKKKMLVR